MMRFSIWSDMPRPWRPPMGVGFEQEGYGVGVVGAVEGADGEALSFERMVISFRVLMLMGVGPERRAHDGGLRFSCWW